MTVQTYYMDKTLAIPLIVNELLQKACLQLQIPSGFGLSSHLDQLEYFLSDNDEISVSCFTFSNVLQEEAFYHENYRKWIVARICFPEGSGDSDYMTALGELTDVLTSALLSFAPSHVTDAKTVYTCCYDFYSEESFVKALERYRQLLLSSLKEIGKTKRILLVLEKMDLFFSSCYRQQYASRLFGVVQSIMQMFKQTGQMNILVATNYPLDLSEFSLFDINSQPLLFFNDDDCNHLLGTFKYKGSKDRLTSIRASNKETFYHP